MKFGVVVWILLGLLGLLIGTKKGRKGILFLSSLLLLGPIGAFIAVLLNDLKNSYLNEGGEPSMNHSQCDANVLNTKTNESDRKIMNIGEVQKDQSSPDIHSSSAVFNISPGKVTPGIAMNELDLILYTGEFKTIKHSYLEKIKSFDQEADVPIMVDMYVFDEYTQNIRRKVRTWPQEMTFTDKVYVNIQEEGYSAWNDAMNEVYNPNCEIVNNSYDEYGRLVEMQCKKPKNPYDLMFLGLPYGNDHYRYKYRINKTPVGITFKYDDLDRLIEINKNKEWYGGSTLDEKIVIKYSGNNILPTEKLIYYSQTSSRIFYTFDESERLVAERSPNRTIYYSYKNYFNRELIFQTIRDEGRNHEIQAEIVNGTLNNLYESYSVPKYSIDSNYIWSFKYDTKNNIVDAIKCDGTTILEHHAWEYEYL